MRVRVRGPGFNFRSYGPVKGVYYCTTRTPIDPSITRCVVMSNFDLDLGIRFELRYFQLARAGPVYHKSHPLRCFPFSKATGDHAESGP